MKKMIGGAALAALLACGPASAAKMVSCTDASMSKTDAMVMKMPDGENKTMAMQEMTSAKSSMSQKDMKGCQMHMAKATQIGMMKPKKK